MLCLILYDSELRLDVVLEMVIVPVQMVGCDVQKDGYVGLEVVHAIKLKTAQFKHVDVVFVIGYAARETLTYIPSETYIQSCILEYVVG